MITTGWEIDDLASADYDPDTWAARVWADLNMQYQRQVCSHQRRDR